MASIRKREGSWVADIRRKGHKSISKSFPTKSLASEWARKIESEIDSVQYQDNRSLDKILLKDLIKRYREEIGAEKPFGKNKTAVIKYLEKLYGNKPVSDITGEMLTKHVRERRKAGVSGVTINIELTYLGGIFKTAKALWKMPVSLEPVREARDNMGHLKISTKSQERDRRPTQKEIDDLCLHFTCKRRQKVPMEDMILFAIETAMRLGEIIRLKWADINHEHKTIIIRDRKHPTEKVGNDQEVPLLGTSYDIALRQARTDERIFPVTEGTTSSIFPRACSKLQIVDLHFHDFRHEGVSRLFEQGYSIEQVSLVSGHRDWKMLQRYTQIRAKDLHRGTK